jgi:hypothetical protein
MNVVDAGGLGDARSGIDLVQNLKLELFAERPSTLYAMRLFGRHGCSISREAQLNFLYRFWGALPTNH